MRRYVLIVGGLEALIWIGAVIWASRQPGRVDIAGLHFFFFVCTVPGLVLGILNRWLKAAVVLVSITAFILVCVAGASKISN